jgi:glutamate 5-kinase
MQINKSKKIVIKLGSSTIVDSEGEFKKKWLLSLIQDIKKLRKKKYRNNYCFLRFYCTRSKLFKN